MPETYINYALLSSDRTSVKNEVVDLFKNELPGTGTGNLASKYTYEVEDFLGYKILLKRPATLNKGFDFVIHVLSPDNDKLFLSNSGRTQRTNPSHKNLIDALLQVQNHNLSYYTNIIQPIILDIFNSNYCTFESDEPLNAEYIDHNSINHPIEIILLAMKWLFIEQDITYWNWSGRQMLMNSLQENDLI